MIERVENPTWSRDDFRVGDKRIGLTGMMLLRNEEDFAMASLESIEPYFDEIVVVYGDCTDHTPEIVAEFAGRHPERVRAFHYVPRIAPIGSDEHRKTPAHSPHSIVNYFNFILSKARYRVRCMWAGDQIAIPEMFGPLIQRIRGLRRGTLEWWLSPWALGYWWYTGVNLWDHEGRIYVNGSSPIIGNYRDHAFYPAGRWLTYKRYSQSQYLFRRVLVDRYAGRVFYHLKGMKQERGTSKYALAQNPQSVYRGYIEKRWKNPALLTMDELRARDPGTLVLPDPETLGIHTLFAR